MKQKETNAELLQQSTTALENEKKTSEKLQEAKEKMEELDKTVGKLKGVLVKANQRFQEDKQTIKDLRSEIASAKKVNEEVLAELDHIRSSSSSTDNLKASIKELEEKVERLNGEMEGVAQDKEMVAAEFEAYRVKAHAALQTNAEEIGKIDSYLEKILKLEGEVKEVKQREVSLNETILELKGKVAGRGELEEQVRDLQDENAELLTQVSFLSFFLFFFFFALLLQFPLKKILQAEEGRRNLQSFNQQWEQKYTQLEQIAKEKDNLVERLEEKEGELRKELEEVRERGDGLVGIGVGEGEIGAGLKMSDGGSKAPDGLIFFSFLLLFVLFCIFSIFNCSFFQVLQHSEKRERSISSTHNKRP